jgi:hypothetical protein
LRYYGRFGWGRDLRFLRDWVQWSLWQDGVRADFDTVLISSFRSIFSGGVHISTLACTLKMRLRIG